LDVRITNIVEHLSNYNVYYYLQGSGVYSCIQFYITKDGFISYAQPFSDLGSDDVTLKEVIERLGNQLASRTDYESEEYTQLIDKLSHATERLNMLGGQNYEAELERTLTGLGFERKDFGRPTKELSGGWRMRIELAKLLLRKPDILLLDEPTNHLDVEAKKELKRAIKEYKGTVLLVSHEPEFYEDFVDSVWNIERWTTKII
jgi:ATP-binding cassette subfamily F protein 3